MGPPAEHCSVNKISQKGKDFKNDFRSEIVVRKAAGSLEPTGGYLLVITDGQHLIPKTSYEMLVAGYVCAEHRERMPAVPPQQR